MLCYVMLCYYSTETFWLSFEDKMAAGAFGRARDYGGEGPFDHFQNLRCILSFHQWNHKKLVANHWEELDFWNENLQNKDKTKTKP